MTAYDERSGYRERMLKAEARAEAAEEAAKHYPQVAGENMRLKERAEAAEKRVKELEGQRAEGWKLRHRTVERPPLVIEDDTDDR
jgi:hypothetical protein